MRPRSARLVLSWGFSRNTASWRATLWGEGKGGEGERGVGRGQKTAATVINPLNAAGLNPNKQLAWRYSISWHSHNFPLAPLTIASDRA